MEINIVEIGNIIKKMEKDNQNLTMVINLQGNSIITELLKEHFILKMEIFMKVNMKMINFTEKED